MRPAARLLATISLVLSFVLPAMAEEPGLTLLSSSTSRSLPAMRPDWPVPTDPQLLFYLQRSMNRNTVVYTANFDATGRLDPHRPLTAFWRRYSDGGAGKGKTKPLNMIENRFAYGVRIRAHDEGSVFDIRFAALPHIPVTLHQKGPQEAALRVRIEGRDLRLVYGYVEIEENWLLPEVTRLRLYTRDDKTGSYVTHDISVSGGAIRK